jgi:RNA polymerase sigma-70 factor (ECF subfamily)
MDEEARLREIMAAYQQPLMVYAQRLTAGDVWRAEDVVQETFVKAWTHLDRLTEDRGSVLGWLRRVAHNLVMDGYRTRKARPTEVDIDSAAGVAGPDLMAEVLDAVVVDQALGVLWPPHQAALREFYLNGRTAAEAGAALGVPAGTVKSRVHHALRVARDVLADHAFSMV